MATRTISTRVAVQGESQYRAAIKGINGELQSMQSALKLTESKYKNNATSTEALTAKNKDLNSILEKLKSKVTTLQSAVENAQKAEQKWTQKKEELTKKIEENKKALEELEKQSGDTSDEQKKLTEENERLNKELEKCESKLLTAKDTVNKWQTQLNKAKTAVNETEDAIEKNSDALDENKQKMDGNSDAINNLAQVLAATQVWQSVQKIADALMECVDASIEFESAMAGVAKTTDLSDAQLATMSDQIKELSTEIPITTTELAGIVEAAGQLGIGEENLLSFATVMANLGVATNLTSEEAATMLARFANVTGMSPELYENLGSVIVALGNSYATTESEIVSMAQRLAAAGEISGLTEPEIMALATAMSSVGIEAEAGGTAMTQTLTAMEKAVAGGGEDLAKFAEISGMSAEEFAAAWENAPITAVEAFIEGLGNLDEKGENATLVLDELGLTGVRQGNMLKSLASASGLLSSTINTANTAWAENNALTKEASTRYATTESKITMFKNSVNNLKIAIGDQLTPALSNLASTGTDVVKWATDFVEANEWLGPALTAVVTALGLYAGALAGLGIAQKLIPIIKALNSTLMTSPYGVVAVAIIGVVSALSALAVASADATKEADELNDAVENSNKAFEESQQKFEDTSLEIEATYKVIGDYIDRLDELNGQTSLTKEEQAEYNTIVNRLKELLPNVDIAVDSTTGKLKTTTEELRVGAEAWKNYAQETAFATILSEQQAALVDTQVSLEKARIELAQYNETATSGINAFVAAVEEERAAHQAVIEARGQGAEAFAEATAAEAEAFEKRNAIYDSLSESEADQATKILALKDSIAENEGALEEQAAQLEKTQAMVDSYKESLDAAAESSQETADNVKEANETVSTFGEGAEEGCSQIPEAMSTATSETKEIADAAKPEITASVTDIGTQAAEGYQGEVNTMVDTTTQVMSDVNQTVSGYTSTAYNSGYGVGAAISQGAAVGVRAYAAQVAAEAAAMVANAIAAAKAAAASASPSKKMITLGKDLDRGLIIGIQELEDQVVKKMHDTMSEIVDVQVEVPNIPDKTASILEAIGSASTPDNRLLTEIEKLVNAKNGAASVNVTQNIYADETSYAGQQREAKRNFRQIARELNR